MIMMAMASSMINTPLTTTPTWLLGLSKELFLAIRPTWQHKIVCKGAGCEKACIQMKVLHQHQRFQFTMLPKSTRKVHIYTCCENMEWILIHIIWKLTWFWKRCQPIYIQRSQHEPWGHHDLILAILAPVYTTVTSTMSIHNQQLPSGSTQSILGLYRPQSDSKDSQIVPVRELWIPSICHPPPFPGIFIIVNHHHCHWDWVKLSGQHLWMEVLKNLC